MTTDTFEFDIKEAIPRLLEIARSLTKNKISDNCKFIFTEIKESSSNFHEQRKLNKKENDSKNPISLNELMPTLKANYHNFYDINLVIYRAAKNHTIIDFRYYPKSSLDPEYLITVKDNSPMLHCRVASPPWLLDDKEKFDINWEHYERLAWIKLWRARLTMKFRMREKNE